MSRKKGLYFGKKAVFEKSFVFRKNGLHVVQGVPRNMTVGK